MTGPVSPLNEMVSDDEIDLDSGFLIVPAALPKKPVTDAGSGDGDRADDKSNLGETGGESKVRETTEVGEEQKPTVNATRDLTISFVADRDALFNAWNALANLADLAGNVSVSAKATSEDGFDKNKLENGVLEPLRELGLIENSDD